MAQKKVILVTGVSSYWGRQAAARLIADAGQRTSPAWEEADTHIIGIDADPPDPPVQGLDFIQADIRNPLLVELFRSEGVDTILHLAFQESARPSETAFDVNVIATMKLMGAAAEAGVRKVVLKSSTQVYGARPTNPAFLTEDHPLQGSRSNGSVRDWLEIEAFSNGFRRQVPEMVVTILRYPGILGPQADTPLTRFLKGPLSPTLLGFDPLMQIIHERDVIESLVLVTNNDAPGVYNVAAEGVLPLSKLTSLAGKLPFPLFHLFAYWGADLIGKGSARLLPIEADYLRYATVADLARMRTGLCFTPRYTAEEALREFAGEQRLRRYLPESAALAYDEERLRDTIERRQRERELHARRSEEGNYD